MTRGRIGIAGIRKSWTPLSLRRRPRLVGLGGRDGAGNLGPGIVIIVTTGCENFHTI